MVTATVIFLVLFLFYSILTDLFKFRNTTAGRYTRLILVGTLAVLTSGGLSVVLWITTIIYGVYVFTASTMGFVFNLFGGSGRRENGVRSKNSIFKTIFNVALGFFAAEGVLTKFGIKDSSNKTMK